MWLSNSGQTSATTATRGQKYVIINGQSHQDSVATNDLANTIPLKYSRSINRFLLRSAGRPKRAKELTGFPNCSYVSADNNML